MDPMNVTVCIPTITGREHDLRRAQRSAWAQEVADPMWDRYEVTSLRDTEGRGPAHVRNLMVAYSGTSDWIAFLDDDDYLLPHHIATLTALQEETDADVVWPWFRVEGGTDPFPENQGRQWDRTNPHIIPITTLVRRSAFLDVGGFDEDTAAQPDPNDPTRTVAGEDWRLWLALSAAGAKFAHTPEITWVWRHHGSNTSGLPSVARSFYGAHT
jgi:glycosyltransferase involved in cell wall biosynthesis